MKILKLLAIGWVVILTLAIFAYGNEWNQKTILKLTEPMQIQGVLLQPGTYVFKLMDSTSDRHIVRIMNQDETQVLATIVGMPHYEFEPPNDARMDFWEARAVTPPAVKTWQFAGEMFGLQFKQPPPTQVAAIPPAPPYVAVLPPPPQVTPAPQPPPPAQAAPPPPRHEAPPAMPPVPRLPRTASGLPLMALLGMASLAISGVFRLFRKREA